jgi:nanoRNase/pAp phosphatase (c-di-AMP/oligoRNAs hydrolase)
MKEKKPIDGPTWETNLKQTIDVINSGNSFLFCGDIDPDSVGSMLSLSLYLTRLNKKVFLVIPEAFADNLDFFEKIIRFNSIQILRNQENIEAVKDEIDTVIFCDTANTKLVPFYPFLTQCILSEKPKVIEIDHHFGADSEELTEHGIKLFRNANANTEIIGTILEMLHDGQPEGPDPFSQRNIILGLITGILGDTVGGKVVLYKEDYDYWMEKLGTRLKEVTRWQDSNDKRGENCQTTKFGDPKQILDYLNRLTKEQESCFNLLSSRIEHKGKLGLLNLLPSTYQEVKERCRPFDSDWFANILGFLVNAVPERSGHAGVIIFEGKNAEGQDCIFIKIRRAVDFSGVDLRTGEEKIKELFGGLYMGGGGHAGAVSFRVHPLEEKELLARLENIYDFFNTAIEAGSLTKVFNVVDGNKQITNTPN